jgi:hypothetical protein
MRYIYGAHCYKPTNLLLLWPFLIQAPSHDFGLEYKVSVRKMFNVFPDFPDVKCIFLFQIIMGKRVSHSSELDSNLAEELLACCNCGDFSVVLGDTMCTSDFYEGERSWYSLIYSQ